MPASRGAPTSALLSLRALARMRQSDNRHSEFDS